MASNKKTLNQAQASVLKTLVYHGIFDFPLKRNELWDFLISEAKIKRLDFDTAIKNLKKEFIFERNGYFVLKNQGSLIDRRKSNLSIVKEKLGIARFVSNYLALISTIEFIGISGGLALGDADKSDDIDFFIITKENSIFKTRFLILIILQFLGLRRKRNDKNPAGKICVNFLIDKSRLVFPINDRDLYIAHEIGQVRPLFERDKTYSRFLNKNKWIFNFLPNLRPHDFEKVERLEIGLLFRLFIFLVQRIFTESISRFIQLVIMRPHKTSEIVANHVLAFNPNDYRVKTLDKLRLKLLEIGLLTRL